MKKFVVKVPKENHKIKLSQNDFNILNAQFNQDDIITKFYYNF